MEKPRIAVVDDKDYVRETVAQILEYTGYSATSLDPNAALATRKAFDLLITDCDMKPVTTGPEVYEAMRKHNSSLKVIYMSGGLNTDNLKPFIAKPLEKLVDLVEQILKSK